MEGRRLGRREGGEQPLLAHRVPESGQPLHGIAPNRLRYFFVKPLGNETSLLVTDG